MNLSLVVSNVQLTLAIVSFLMNGLLITLIALKSPKTLGIYKFLMMFMSAFEIFYALIDLLVKPEVRTKDYYWVTETNSQRSILPLSVAYPLLLIWACSFGIALACFGVHFVYRYFIVTGNTKWISGFKNCCLWMTFPILSGFVYGVTIHAYLYFDQVLDINLRFARAI
ncbi:hypothetical protein CAEBREN_20014 [Caenorhabditis brenneri]|uniref:G-protein coupled receptors family 1 profile domain-containing protein n=1 Tax=Caenorhabditis brenneri TaxID=135651 RepID=G0NF29_CAEBE|nr:hypothetical protein CAEBREN_20014 [Caenorhabditis brenneri]